MLSPLAAVFVQPQQQDSSPCPPAGVQAPAQAAPDEPSAAADEARRPLSLHNATIKRMLDDGVVFSSPAGASGTSPAAAAVTAAAGAAGQEQQGSPAQGFAKRMPPPGFGPAPQHCKGMQQEEPVLSVPAGVSGPCAEVPAASQPAPAYIACGNQVPPAPMQQQQQQPPLRQPSFHQRLPSDGAPWQQATPVGLMDGPQQAAFFAACSNPMSPFGVLNPQQQQQQQHLPPLHQQQGVPPPRPPPYEPPPCAAFAGAPVGFEGPPAGFGLMQGPPPAAGYMTWQQKQQQHLQQQQQQYWQLPPAEVMGLFQLQHLAAQRKQHQAAHPAPPAGPNPPFKQGYGPGQCRPPPGSPASPAPRAYAPPPPPRPPMQAYPGMNMHAPSRFTAPQHGAYPGPQQHAGYPPAGYHQPAAAGPAGMAGRTPAYAGFGPRSSSGPPQAHAGHSVQPGFGERLSSSNAASEVHPVIAALPRSASALWEPSAHSSPLASTCNLRRSNSYDGTTSRLCAEPAAAAPPAAGTLLAVAGAAVLALSGRRMSQVGTGSGAPAAPWANSGRHSGKAALTGAPGVSTGRRSSSGGGSFISAMGRASSRGLAWDPLSGLSSGGGAQPPSGGDASSAPRDTARPHVKPRAVAAKMPLVYTPAAMADRDDTWTSGAAEGPNLGTLSGGGGRITFSMSQLGPADMEVMFRKLRVGVRGPDARPI